MSLGPLEPDADPRLRFDEQCCECGGLGVVTDAAHAGGSLWMVTWRTEHRRGCAGCRFPERSFLVNADALDAGDETLPGLPGDRP